MLRFFLFLSSLFLCEYSIAQHIFRSNVPLKVYAEPSIHTQILAIIQPTDSVGVIRAAYQDQNEFWRVVVWQKNKIGNSTSEKPIYGFIATQDLDTKDPKTSEIAAKVKTHAFTNVTFDLTCSDVEEPIKAVTITTKDKRKKLISAETHWADDFLGQKAHLKRTLPTHLRQIEVENDHYLRCKLKYWNPNPDNHYTIKIQMQKRNFWNWIFKPSKVIGIDSTSESARYAAIQVVRKRDSCIVWHEDNSHKAYKWSGECKDGYANGRGTLQLDTNRIYQGAMLMGMLEGEGTLRDNAWEIQGKWKQGELVGTPTVHTVLYYKNMPPARDTVRYKMYPNYAPITKWYQERNDRMKFSKSTYSTKGFRRNDVLYPYYPSAFQLVLPDNENPALKTYKSNDCVSFTTWRYKGFEPVGVLFGSASFFEVWCKKNDKGDPSARLYYWARDNKWYWWGAVHSSGPYPTFADAVKNVCGCKH